MKPSGSTVLCVVALLLSAAVAQNQPAITKSQSSHAAPPYWAFAVNPPEPTSKDETKPADNTPLHVPNSAASFTLAQLDDPFSAPDWHPAGHPAMPEIVAHGSKPNLYACAYCHLPNAMGRPENASLAGLRADYIVQQLADFKSGRRKSSNPKFLPASFYMVGVAAHADEQQVRSAAAYFAALKPKPWIRVVETTTVPKTHVAGWMLVASGGGTMEPIGQRIIETPENLELTERRDDASGFIAYVPVGSLKQGQALVTTGAGKTIPCATCHGADLRGMTNVPSIAGRSPSYIVRQLYDIQHGSRAGANVELMKAPAAKLTIADMIAIAAYTASLHP